MSPTDLELYPDFPTEVDKAINPATDIFPFACHGSILTKRERFAARAMQGILASETELFSQTPSELAAYALSCADALLEALEK